MEAPRRIGSPGNRPRVGLACCQPGRSSRQRCLWHGSGWPAKFSANATRVARFSGCRSRWLAASCFTFLPGRALAIRPDHCRNLVRRLGYRRTRSLPHGVRGLRRPLCDVSWLCCRSLAYRPGHRPGFGATQDQPDHRVYRERRYPDLRNALSHSHNVDRGPFSFSTAIPDKGLATDTRRLRSRNCGFGGRPAPAATGAVEAGRLRFCTRSILHAYWGCRVHLRANGACAWARPAIVGPERLGCRRPVAE